MIITIENATDVVTRTVSKHGIVHSLELFKGRTVKIIAMDDPTKISSEPISEKPYFDIEPDIPEEPEVPEPTFKIPDTLDRMRDFVKTP